jgi:hypothetical protein
MLTMMADVETWDAPYKKSDVNRKHECMAVPGGDFIRESKNRTNEQLL